MPMKLEDLAKEINPKNTVLLFGSGSSIPSGAPSVATLIDKFSKAFGVEANGYNLSEVASLCEAKKSRRKVIDLLRELCAGLKPMGGLKNLPLYPWKSIFTTNYDDLIEKAYAGKGKRYGFIIPISASRPVTSRRTASCSKSMAPSSTTFVTATLPASFSRKRTTNRPKHIEKIYMTA